MPSAANSPPSTISTARNPPRPSTPAVMKKRRFDQVRPACAIFTDSGTDLALTLRCSSSLSVPSTCSRRVFVGLRVERAGATDPVRATVSMRFSAFRSPDRNG